jgi:hypothetical protein
MASGAQPDPLAAVVVLPAQGGRRPHGPEWATRPSGAWPEWPKLSWADAVGRDVNGLGCFVDWAES